MSSAELQPLAAGRHVSEVGLDADPLVHGSKKPGKGPVDRVVAAASFHRRLSFIYYLFIIYLLAVILC